MLFMCLTYVGRFVKFMYLSLVITLFLNLNSSVGEGVHHWYCTLAEFRLQCWSFSDILFFLNISQK